MATCGYICPQCEGRGLTDEGLECTWCKPISEVVLKKDSITDEQWNQSVHEGSCCGDWSSTSSPEQK
jgi:hypothetical protein